MDRRTLVAISLTVGVVALVLVSSVNGAMEEREFAQFGACTRAELGLIVGSPIAALPGAFVCAVFLAARGTRAVAYILLVAALAIVAGSIATVTVGLCGPSSADLELVAPDPAFDAYYRRLNEINEERMELEPVLRIGSVFVGGVFVATVTGVAALIGLVAGWVPGRLVRWFRER